MASRIALVTDSTSDLPADLARAHGITIVPETVTLEGRSYLDGVDITAEEFYRKLAATDQMPITSTPSPGRFAETYEALLRDHDQVLSLHLPVTLSGTYAAATQGAALVAPERIHIVDTRVVSMALGLLVLAASKAMAENEEEDAEAIWTRVEPVRDGMRVHFMVGTLEYLRRGGRIGRASALVGSVLQVKPVLALTDGVITPLERVRTTEKALTRVIELARDRGERLCACVGHSAAPELCARLSEAIEDQCETLLAFPLGPVVGAHAGPGTVGVGAYPADLFPLGIGRFSAAAAS
jgi:DegV family protein with EDD domain